MGASHSVQTIFRLPLLSGEPSGHLPPPRPLRPHSPMGWLFLPLVLSVLVALAIYMETHGGWPELPVGFQPKAAAVPSGPSRGNNNSPAAPFITHRPGAPRSASAPAAVAGRPSPKTDNYPPAQVVTARPGPSPSGSYPAGTQTTGQGTQVTSVPASGGSANQSAWGLSIQQPAGTRIQFKLDKSMGRQQVGPAAVELLTTDGKNQRYTIRLFVENQSIEMNDRTLREEVKIDIRGVAAAAELVVTEISQNQIAGYLVLHNTVDKR